MGDRRIRLEMWRRMGALYRKNQNDADGCLETELWRMDHLFMPSSTVSAASYASS